MTKPTPVKALVACLFFFLLQSNVNAQDCSNPAALCPLFSSDTLNTADGAPLSVPGDFCFDEAPNAVFFSFNTLDTDQFTFIDYQDSTATVFLEIDSCNTDTIFAQSLNLAIFTADDLCDLNTYGPSVFCTTEIEDSGGAQLDGLMPATTYYVMVTGLFGDAPATEPSACAFNVGVTGPAVNYDLEPDPDGPITITPGQSATLAVNPGYADLEWMGDGADGATGPAVTVSPDEVGVYRYEVFSEIDGCQFSETFTVIVEPPINPFNAFTPNSDGFNDTWEIDRIQEYPNAQIVIYSRWGSKVFQTTNYRNDWDGDDLPAATYYYVIELNDIENFDAPPITGSVTIMR
jgi:gliding motility-associated-like protein